MTLVQEEDADDTGTSDGFQYFSRARGSALYWAGFTKSAGMSWNDALSHRPPPTFRLVKLRSQAAQQGRGAKNRSQHRQAAGAVRSEEPTSSDASQGPETRQDAHEKRGARIAANVADAVGVRNQLKLGVCLCAQADK